MKDILDTLTADGSFETLLSLLRMVDLSERLRKPGPFTLFAPNDEAFMKMKVEELTSDREQLVELLTYHLVDGKLNAGEVARSEQLLTSSGKSLSIHLDEGRPVIDNARYVATDIECANGIIHVIDNVFLPHLSGWYCGCC